MHGHTGITRFRAMAIVGTLILVLTSGALAIRPRSATAAVDLLYFRATPSDNSILLEWETATEVGTVAFNLYRSQDSSTTGQRIGPTFPVKGVGGGITGAKYDYTDTRDDTHDVVAGVRYYYSLEEISSSGGRTIRPEKANAGIDMATLTPTETAPATATAPASATPTATSDLSTGATATVTGSPTATVSTGTQTTGTATPTKKASGDQPTATRAYTNTPRPDATVTPAGTPAVTQSGAAIATPSSSAPVQVATPTGGPQVAAPAPAGPSATPLLSSQAAGMSPSPSPQIEVTATPMDTVEPTPRVTRPPAIFEPVSTEQPAGGTPREPSAQTAGSASGEAERNTRLVLFLGGGAIGLAALLGAAAVLIWRSRSR